jgi:hypothetical protein
MHVGRCELRPLCPTVHCMHVSAVWILIRGNAALVSWNLRLEVVWETFQSANVDVKLSQVPCFTTGKSKMKCTGLLHTKQNVFYQTSLWIDVIFLKRESRKRLHCKNGLRQWLRELRDIWNYITSERFRAKFPYLYLTSWSPDTSAI